MQVCDLNKCTGCCACMNICPKNSISMVEDKYGKIISKIDDTECVNCSMCQKICPVNSPPIFNEIKECYACWTKDADDSKTCASGGAATVLSRKIINNGGYVFGTVFDPSVFAFTHVFTENAIELEKFKGSRYVQSYTGLSYTAVKQQLKNNKEVIFIGTPCQIAGLYAFLGENPEKLFTVDLICHGTPPMKYLKQHLEKNCDKNKITDISFRGKNDFVLTAYDGKKTIYEKAQSLDSYFLAFSNGLIHRENCYSCPYAVEKRCSDITIGDFWGIDRNSLNSNYDGRISVALLNTPKGINLFNSVKVDMNTQKRLISEAVKGNNQLRKPSVKHGDRNKFLNTYMNKGFYEAIKATSVPQNIKKAKIRKIILWPYRKLKKMVKR